MTNEIEISADLSDAFIAVLGEKLSTPRVVHVVAWYLDALAKSYGLSESEIITEYASERVVVSDDVQGVLKLCLGDMVIRGDDDVIRERLYAELEKVSKDQRARRRLNQKNPPSDARLLAIAQVYWNLEWSQERRSLPLRPHERESGQGRRIEIPLPGTVTDAAELRLTDRTKAGVEWDGHTVSKAALRRQGARLAVILADSIVRAELEDVSKPISAKVVAESSTNSRVRIVWPNESPSPKREPDTSRDSDRGTSSREQSDGLVVTSGVASGRKWVFVNGGYEAPNRGYVRRRHDEEVDRVWNEGTEHVVWLRGGPGVGKSYSARRIVAEALSPIGGAEGEDLVIWVDSANSDSVRRALARAAEELGIALSSSRQAMEIRESVNLHQPPARELRVEMPGLGWNGLRVADFSSTIPMPEPRPATESQPLEPSEEASREAKANALIRYLSTGTLRWLIVLDNADAAGLVHDRLLPREGGGRGRLLVTTNQSAHLYDSFGVVVDATVFDADETSRFLQVALPDTSDSERRVLQEVTGGHPLATAIAVATIRSNSMHLLDFIAEFADADRIDDAADERDRGGYPHSIGSMWRYAIASASEGLPEGIVERVAVVAAIQDPDGHPTWLWQREAVLTWVGDGNPVVDRHGMPEAVRRLIDYGIFELKGNWNAGRIAMHQLAARAARELLPVDELQRIGAVLVNEWLLRCSEGVPWAPQWMHGNISPLVGLDIPDRLMQRTATVLLASSAPPTSGLAESKPPTPEQINDRVLAVRRNHALFMTLRGKVGARAKIEIAEPAAIVSPVVASLGERETATLLARDASSLFLEVINGSRSTDRDRVDAAKALRQLLAMWEGFELPEPEIAHVIEMLAVVVENVSSDQRVHADALDAMADLSDCIGRHDEAHDQREAALDLHGHVVKSSTEPSVVFSVVGRMREVFEALDDNQRWHGFLAGVIRHLGEVIAPDMASAGGDGESEWVNRFSTAQRLQQYAGYQEELGVLDDAKRTYLVAVERLRQLDGSGGWHRPLRKAARLSCRLALWNEAEGQLMSLVEMDGQVEDFVLLASIRTRLGDERGANVALEHAMQVPADNEPNAGSPRSLDLELIDLYLRGLSPEFVLSRVRTFESDDEESDGLIAVSRVLADIEEQKLNAEAGAELSAVRERAMAAIRLAGWSYAGRQYERSMIARERAVSLLQFIIELDPADHESERDLARISFFLWCGFSRVGDTRRGLSSLERAVAIMRGRVERDPENQQDCDDLGTYLGALVRAFTKLDMREDAKATSAECVQVMRRYAERNPADEKAQLKLAQALCSEAYLSITSRELGTAHENLKEALDLAGGSRLDIAGDETERIELMASIHLVIGGSGFVGDDERLGHLMTGVDLFRQLSDENPTDLDWQANLMLALAALAETSAEQDRAGERQDYYMQASNVGLLIADLCGDDPSPQVSRNLTFLPRILRECAAGLREHGRVDEADEMELRADDLERRFPALGEE